MPDRWIIGTRHDCDLVMNIPSVSGRHCRLTREPAGLFLEDLGSTNGTYVNGVRLPVGRAAPIKPDDVVHLGSHPLDLRGLLGGNESGDGTGAGELETLEFRAQPIVIGRNPACDCVIDRPMVSSQHARLFRQSAEVLIEDLGSSNGTFVNGQRIDRPTVVRPGDIIGLGSYSLALVFPPGSVPPEPPEVHREVADAPAATAWPILALLAQVPLAALLMAAAARSNLPAGLFGLVLAATWFGISAGIQAESLNGLICRFDGHGRGVSPWIRTFALGAIVLVACQIAWIIIANLAGLRGATLPCLAYLALAGGAGLALGLLIDALVPNRVSAWMVSLAMMAGLCLLGGWRPTLRDVPDAVRPLFGLTPTRWAFEGLLLAEGAKPARLNQGDVVPDVPSDLVEAYFPASSERMGPAADALALVLMVLGLMALVWYVLTNLRPIESSNPSPMDSAAGTA